MGGIQSISKKCLPYPTDVLFRTELESRGVVFSLPEDGKRVTMCDVTLPEGWGLYKTSDRGDIVNAYLVDKDLKVVARIFWMSKGSYDNEASMNRAYGKEKLDPSFVEYNDGFYCPKKRDCDVLCDMVNNYYHSQYAGSCQAELDEMRAKIWTWCESHPGDETLVSGWNRDVRLMAETCPSSAGRAAAIRFAKIASVPTQKVLVGDN